MTRLKARPPSEHPELSASEKETVSSASSSEQVTGETTDQVVVSTTENPSINFESQRVTKSHLNQSENIDDDNVQDHLSPGGQEESNSAAVEVCHQIFMHYFIKSNTILSDHHQIICFHHILFFLFTWALLTYRRIHMRKMN